VTSVVKLYWDQNISFVKNIAFVKTENAVVLGAIRDCVVINVSKNFENNIQVSTRSFRIGLSLMSLSLQS
jgi:hypothetical protein